MTEWIWLNGHVQPLADATISVEDRGFQFADGVYEVIRLYGGQPFTLDEHLQRLEKSAQGIRIDLPLSRAELAKEIVALVNRSHLDDGMVYLQLTRGAAPRSHVWSAGTQPTLLFYVRSLPPLAAPGKGDGVKLISVDDERWERCWVKSIALLPNILAKQAAADAGADEAVFVKNGVVNECAATNLFIVTDGVVITHPVGPKVLPGITRQRLLEIARRLNIRVEERGPTLAEAKSADEVFITSTTRELAWVQSLDGQPIRPGGCGPVTLRLHTAFRETAPKSLPAATAAAAH